MEDVMEILENILQGKQINTDVILTMIVSLYGVTIIMFLFKSIPTRIINFIMHHFTTGLFISSMDDCFYSLVKIFENNNTVNKVRNFRFMNGRYGGSKTIDKSIGTGTHYFFYKRIPIKVNYSIEKTEYSSAEKIHMALTKFGRSHKLFDELRKELQNILEIENQGDENKLKIYSLNKDGFRWTSETNIMKRDFNTIFIEDDIKKRLFNHFDNFYSKEEWYHERGIPYQTGICLYGPAGTGKTSIVKGLASHYNKKLCILRSGELDLLPYALRRLPHDAFIVIEDIDTSSIVMERNPEESLEDSLYNIGKKSNNNGNDESVPVGLFDDSIPSKNESNYEVADVPVGESESKSKNNKSSNNSQTPSYMKVLLSDILNAMDGLISVEKRVIIFTTNHVEKLDRALIRPGRIDCLEKIDYISYGQFIRFCTIFYKDTITEEEKNKLSTMYSGLKGITTVAELQKNFMQGMTLDEMMKTYCK
jgi:chaperone BCS1